MKKIVSLIVALFSASVVFAQGDLHLFEVDNKDGKISSITIEKTLKENGFDIGLRSEMNKPFKLQFKQTDFKAFTLLTIYHTKLSRDLVLKYPDAGVITPMGVGIYQKLNDDTLHVSILTSQTQSKILGIKKEKILEDIESQLIKALKIALPGAKQKYSEDSLKENRGLVTRYELEMEEGDDPEETIEDLIMSMDGEFKTFGFIAASTADYNEVLTIGGTVESPFHFYRTYSICKLEVIYTVAKSRPEASAFAPCTTMVYQKKGSNTVVIGFPSVYNWMSSAKVDDKESKAVLIKAQKSFESILSEITE